MRRVIALILVLLLLIPMAGCGPKLLVKPFEPPEIKFDETPPYNVRDDLDAIQKPKSPKKEIPQRFNKRTTMPFVF